MDFVPDEVKIDKETLGMLAALARRTFLGLLKLSHKSMIAPPVFCQGYWQEVLR